MLATAVDDARLVTAESEERRPFGAKGQTFPKLSHATTQRRGNRLRWREAPLRHEDRERAKELHNKWYPLKYEEEFFWAICCPHNNSIRLGVGSGYRDSDPCGCSERIRSSRHWRRYRSLHCMGAYAEVEDENDEGERRKEQGGLQLQGERAGAGNARLRVQGIKQEQGLEESEQRRWRQEEDTQEQRQRQQQQQKQQQQQQQRQQQIEEQRPQEKRQALIGCWVSKSFRAIENRDEDLVQCPSPSIFDDRTDHVPEYQIEVEYLMTLGVDSACRRHGVASALLRSAVRRCAENPRCKAIYLHVICYNASACRFYERNGFERLRRNPGFYTIDGEPFDSFIYVTYVNGGRRAPQSLAEAFTLGIWDTIEGVTSLCTGVLGRLGLGGGGGGGGGRGVRGGSWEEEGRSLASVDDGGKERVDIIGGEQHFGLHLDNEFTNSHVATTVEEEEMPPGKVALAKSLSLGV